MNMQEQATTTLTEEAQLRLGRAIAFILALAEEASQNPEELSKSTEPGITSDPPDTLGTTTNSGNNSY